MAIVFSGTALAAPSVDVCKSIFSSGTQDMEDNYTDTRRFDVVKTFVCSLTIETEQDAKRYSSEIGIDVFDIIGISGGEKENTKTIAEKKKSFCGSTSADLSAQSLKYSSIKKASPVLSQSFVECVRILADVKGLFAAVTQDRNRVGFTIYLSYKDDTDLNVKIKDISARPAKIECSRDIQNATEEHPFSFSGRDSFSCQNMTPQLSARLVISTNKGPPNESTTGFELIGQIDTLTDISDRIHRLENQVLQPGFVGYFDRDCPHGWDKYGLAEGRYIVGQFSKLKEPQGIALTPGENRAVSAHDHSFEFDSVLHPDQVNFQTPKRKNATQYSGLWAEFKSPSPKGVYLWNVRQRTDKTGDKEGTTAPYLTLMPCIKSN